MTEKKTTLPYLTDEEWKNLKGRHGKGKQVISFKLILARPRDIIVINKKKNTCKIVNFAVPT